MTDRHRPARDILPVRYTRSNTWHTNYEAALEEARRTGRPLLVRASAEWCGHCQRMKRDVWSDARLDRDIARNFIPVELDADNEQNRRLLERMRVQTLPTVLVITPELRIVERIEGYRSVNQLAAQLREYTPRVELPLRDDHRSVVLR